MGTIESLGHTRWDCKYHLVWIPKCRRTVLYRQLCKHLWQVLHDLAGQKERVVHQGEKRHSPCTKLPGPAQELHQDALLGPRLLCFDCRCR